MSYLDLTCRTALVVVLAVAAVGKLSGRAAVTGLVASLRPLVPDARAAAAVAAILVGAEVGTAVLLLAVPPAGYVAAALLLVVLAAGVARVLRRGLAVSCRCFGPGGGAMSGRHLVRNLVLLAVAVAGLGAHQAAGPPGPLAAAAVLGGAGAGLAITRWDDLAYLTAGPAPSTRAGAVR